MSCFGRKFLRNTRPIYWVFPLFIVWRMLLLSLTLCNSSSFLTLSAQMTKSILIQKHISKLSSYFCSNFEVSKFNTIHQLCSKFSTLLVSSLNLSPICSWKSPILVECCLFPWKFLKKFHVYVCIICYQVINIAEIIHIRRLFLL